VLQYVAVCCSAFHCSVLELSASLPLVKGKLYVANCDGVVCMHMHTHTHTRTHTHMHTHAHIHTCTHKNTHTHTHMYTPEMIGNCSNSDVVKHTRTYKHAHTHTHTHTQTQAYTPGVFTDCGDIDSLLGVYRQHLLQQQPATAQFIAQHTHKRTDTCTHRGIQIHCSQDQL